MKFFRASGLQYYTRGVPLSDCYAWGEPIYAPFDGSVITVRDGWPECNPVHLIRDLVLSTRDVCIAYLDKSKRFAPLAGNHVIMKRAGQEVYALMAHLRTGSVRARKGEPVRSGQVVGEVGHSGNSSGPHLHFHLMDGPDPVMANGLPCRFADYAVLERRSRSSVSEGIPTKRQRIRSPA